MLEHRHEAISAPGSAGQMILQDLTLAANMPDGKAVRKRPKTRHVLIVSETRPFVIRLKTKVLSILYGK